MRLMASDIIEGVLIELYPYGPLLTVINDAVDTMTQSIKNKEEVTHKIIDVNLSSGEKYGLLVIGPENHEKG